MRIIHPEPGFTGSASGIQFENGEADIASLSDEARGVLTENGYTIEGASEPAKVTKSAKVKADGKVIGSLSVVEPIDPDAVAGAIKAAKA